MEVSGYWRKRCACGGGEANSFMEVFPIAPILPISNVQYGISAGFLGMIVPGVAYLASGGREARERGNSYQISQKFLGCGYQLFIQS